MEPLYQPLNDAVHAIVSKLLPQGYNVSNEAPDTLQGITDYYRSTGRLCVSSLASTDTIYGDPATNHAARAWHDYHHIKGKFAFNLLGEVATFKAQAEDLAEYFNPYDTVTEEPHRIARAYLRADIVGQTEFYHVHKRFVVRQRAFCLAYVRNPVAALADGSF